MKKLLIYCFLFTVFHTYQGISQKAYKDQFAHTFSIVARDSVTGEMAVGVQSHWFAVGSIVSWGHSGVGVVATQSFVNPAYGPDGLQLMSKGISAQEALKKLVAQDEGKEFRQIAFLDTRGNVAAYTGEKCISSAHHILGKNFAVQANMMLNDKVVPAMEKAFKKHASLSIADRVIKVLQAAQDAGGDIRGKQSAALIVVNAEVTSNPWEDKKINLRVDDHPNPIEELSRLLTVHKAYEHMNNGDLAIEKGQMQKAMQEYDAAANLFPDNLEMKFWKAVTMANNKQFEASLPIFDFIFKQDNNWKELTKRLPKSGLLTLNDTQLKTLLDL